MRQMWAMLPEWLIYLALLIAAICWMAVKIEAGRRFDLRGDGFFKLQAKSGALASIVALGVLGLFFAVSYIIAQLSL